MYVIQGKIQLIESIFNVIYDKIKGGGAKGAGGGKGTGGGEGVGRGKVATGKGS